MSRFIVSGFAMAILLATNWTFAAGHFYRIAANSGTVITGLTEEGELQWSNVVASGEFLVERSVELDPTTWTPYFRGLVTNSLLSRKVHEFSPPNGMVFIPGGRFTMGDTFDEYPLSTPTRTVEVSPFFINTNEVNNLEMRGVLQWAYAQNLIRVADGVVENTEGTTKVLIAVEWPNNFNEIEFSEGVFTIKEGREQFPCVFVSWFGAAAYCNYRSMMEGLDTCYDLNDWTCDFTKSGYRLPTEAEWEFAGRGGHEGRRFVWGDLITHSNANYRSSTNYAFDVSPTLGFHPDYASNALRTSPVGVFAPNDYGLFDINGNVWEWCWDWSKRYPRDTEIDPTGPESGTYKIFRGGSNFTTAERVQTAARYMSAEPDRTIYDVGFRIAFPANSLNGSGAPGE